MEWLCNAGAALWGGGQQGNCPLKVSKKGQNLKYGFFHVWELLKLAFLSSLRKKYMLWEGFYKDFSTKKMSASGDFPPPTPTKRLCPLDPKVPLLPLTIYPDAIPWLCIMFSKIPMPVKDIFSQPNKTDSFQHIGLHMGWEVVRIRFTYHNLPVAPVQGRS